MPNTPSYSRGRSSCPFGKLSQVIKTKIDENTEELAKRRARDLGYPGISEWLRDLIMVDVHGAEFMLSLYTSRLSRMVQVEAQTGPQQATEVPSGGNTE